MSAVVLYAADHAAARSARPVDKPSEERQVRSLFAKERESILKVLAYADDYDMRVRECERLRAELHELKSGSGDAGLQAPQAPLLVDTVQLPDGLTLVVVRPGKVSLTTCTVGSSRCRVA